MSRLIRIYTVCHSVIYFRLKPLSVSVNVSKFKDGRVHCRNLGVKKFRDGLKGLRALRSRGNPIYGNALEGVMEFSEEFLI